MNVRQINRATFDAAVAAMSERYKGNVEILQCEPEGTGFRFRLTVKDSRGLGSAASGSSFPLKDGTRRRTGSACWHAHGYLFEAILELSPESWITTGMSQGRIDVYGGNWQDRNAGSEYRPAYASDLCECENNEIS